MSEEKKEGRAEEVARVRGYLTSQAAKRTPAQIIEALREAHQQFVAATNAVPEAKFRVSPNEGEWPALDILEHVRLLAEFDVNTIVRVIEQGEQPKINIDLKRLDAPNPAPDATRQKLLTSINDLRELLIGAVLKADPTAYLDITWGHSEFGQMNWREWLLFARVHTLDHARQMQSIANVFNLQLN